MSSIAVFDLRREDSGNPNKIMLLERSREITGTEWVLTVRLSPERGEGVGYIKEFLVIFLHDF